ncbi:MAG TPA: hypothetical protein DD490_11200 [Acidobacteria bacterium]|nr:hypothetical protein [Acidobacteriota bacterium]
MVPWGSDETGPTAQSDHTLKGGDEGAQRLAARVRAADGGDPPSFRERLRREVEPGGKGLEAGLDWGRRRFHLGEQPRKTPVVELPAKLTG